MIRRIHIVLLFALCTVLSCTNETTQKVKIETSEGDIVVALYSTKAPITVENFLKYVDAKKYDGTTFYRSVRQDNQRPDQPKIEVIQGGLYTDTTSMLEPIKLERTSQTGLQHLDGTISMARSTPDSGRSEFFICINPQPSLNFEGTRNPDGQGFAAFGKVIEGMDVVKKIQASETTYYPSLDLPQLIVNPVRIIKIGRI